MSTADFQVYLVDDDLGVLKALSRLLQTAGYQTKTFSSSEQFLDEHDPSVPGCAVLDLTMPENDGLEVQQRLAQQPGERPIIFLTGHGSIRESVSAMRAGAVDFLLKPVNGNELLSAIARAASKDEATRKLQADKQEIAKHLKTLTPRERQVLTHVIAGRLNKQIAATLGTVEKTVKVHRSRMMAKMGAKTVADLVRKAVRIGLQPLDQSDSHPE